MVIYCTYSMCLFFGSNKKIFYLSLLHNFDRSYSCLTLLQANSLADIATLKNQLNQLRTDHVDLQEKAAKLRYVEHPANSNNPPPEVADAALKNTVNQLAHENDDLKTAIGKMRYRPYVVSPGGAGNVADDDGVVTASEKTNPVPDSEADCGPSQDELVDRSPYAKGNVST